MNNSYTTTALLNSPNTVGQANQAASLTFYPTDNYNLPYSSPHVQDQFAWGASPVDDNDLAYVAQQNSYSPVGTVTMGLKVPGTQLTLGAFPSAQRIASTTFQSNSGLLSVDLAVAFNNQSDDGELGVFLCKDNGPSISLETTSDVYDGVLAPQGFYSKRSGASFSLDIAPLIKSNTALALYAVGYGTNLATSSISVVCILRYASLDG